MASIPKPIRERIEAILPRLREFAPVYGCEYANLAGALARDQRSLAHSILVPLAARVHWNEKLSEEDRAEVKALSEDIITCPDDPERTWANHPLKRDVRRDRQVICLMTSDERHQLICTAQQAGMSTSAYIRQKLFG